VWWGRCEYNEEGGDEDRILLNMNFKNEGK